MARAARQVQYARVIVGETTKPRDAYGAVEEERPRLGRRLEKLIEADLMEDEENEKGEVPGGE